MNRTHFGGFSLFIKDWFHTVHAKHFSNLPRVFSASSSPSLFKWSVLVLCQLKQTNITKVKRTNTHGDGAV